MNQIYQQEVLRYGQIIRIHGNYIDAKQGLLTAKGFTDRNVYYQTYQKFNYLNNYRESLFKILPRGSFEIHDEYQKITTSSKNKELLSIRLKTEAEQYNMVIQNRLNDEIFFGSEVVFQHLDSGYFLLCQFKCSEFSTDAFKLEIADLKNSQIVFKIQPFHSYQQEGQQVLIDEPVVIQHNKSQCLIDFVQNKRVFIDDDIQQNIYSDDMDSRQYERFHFTVRKPQEGDHRFEAVSTHNCKTNWIIKLHEQSDDHSKDRMKLKPYDLCIFEHTQKDSYLSVEGESNRVILKQLKVQKNPNNPPLEAIWELQIVELENQKCNQSENSQQILDQNQNEKYIIRHCLTGKVMTTYEIINTLESDIRVNDINLTQKNQLFEIQSVKQTNGELINNSFVKILQNKIELQAKIINKNLNHFKRYVSNHFKKLDDENLDYFKEQVQFHQDNSIHAFKINKVSDEIKKDLLYIMSSQEILMQFSDILVLPTQEAENKLDSNILGQIVQVFRKLLAYIINLNGNEEDVLKSELLPLENRQRYLKDLYMAELIMDILFIMSFQKDKLFKQLKSERERLQQIFELSYVLIEKMTKNNPQIKLHVSQWLELFLNQAMVSDDLIVQASLNELLDDNYLAISKFITKQSIKRLIDRMSLLVHHEKYLRILSSICMCNGKSILNNQQYILELFFQKVQPEFKFNLRQQQKGDPVQILSFIAKKEPKWRTLKQLFHDSQIQDELQTWNYFLSYFNLMGDICANRNKFAKIYVEENYPLDILCSMIEDVDCSSTNAHEPFLKVIHFAYIDCLHYTPIRRIARVREWNTIEQKNDILRTKAVAHLQPENCDVQRVMDFIDKFLVDFKYFSKRDKNYNNIMYTILQVLRTTLSLGFWKSIENLKNLFPHLFRICSSNRDFKEFIDPDNPSDHRTQEHYQLAKSQLTKMNLENVIVMKCKILACEIIDIIMDMETNVRVSKTTQQLKLLVTQFEDQNLTQSEQVNDQINTSVKFQEQDLMPLSIYKYPQNMQQRRVTQNDYKNQQLYNVEIWRELNRQLINERDMFGILGSQLSVEVIFAEMSGYENPQMLQWGLKLLNRIYCQRQELVQNFEKILIVAEGVTYNLSVESRVTRTKLLALEDRNILECTLENQNSFNVFLWRESSNPKESGIIQDLNYLVQSMKKGQIKREDIKIQYDSLNPKNGLFQIFTERESMHKLHQSLLKCQDLHESILSFIKICRDVSKLDDILMKLLHSSYNFLTMISLNHSENKLNLMKYMEIMYNHLGWNVGCVEFLQFIIQIYQQIQSQVLYQNNKVLLYSDKDIIRLMDIIISQACLVGIDQYFKSRLMDLLRVLLIFDQKMIKQNQLGLMAKLQEKQNIQVMYIIPKSDIKELNGSLWCEDGFKNLIKQYQDQYEQGIQEKCVIISAELTYMYTYFQIFCLLIEDRNEINAGKCRNMHQFGVLLNILGQSKQCWPLKRYLREYINRLYYGQDNFENISQLVVEYDIENIINDLQQLIEIRQNREYFLNFKQVKLQNAVRYSYLISYVYLYLEELLITLNILFNKEKFLYDLEDILSNNIQERRLQLHFQFFEIAQKIDQLRVQWNKSTYISQFTSVLINIFKSIFRTFDLQILFIYGGLLNSLNQMKCVTEKVVILHRRVGEEGQGIIEQEFLISESGSDPLKFFKDENSMIQPDISTISSLECSDMTIGYELTCQLKEQLIDDIFIMCNRVVNKRFIGKQQSINVISKQGIKNTSLMSRHIGGDWGDDINVVYYLKHRHLINTLNLSSRYQKFIEEEFVQVWDKLSQIEAQSKKIYEVEFPVITLKEFIQNIIRIHLNQNNLINDDLRIFMLKVLTRIITEKNQANKDYLLPVDEWKPEILQDCKAEIQQAQNFLEDCGSAELICQLLREPNLEQRMLLTSELLTFAIAFLIGGNSRCQNSIMCRLKEDTNNLMLQNYATMIKKVGRSIYTNFKIRKNKEFHLLQNQNEYNYQPFNVLMIDDYDVWDQSAEMMVRRGYLQQEDNAKETTLKLQACQTAYRSFRVLQLLCENNNIAMKNFIRQQTDKDGSNKLNSINFIELTTNQLRIFLKIMNKGILKIPSFMLDFLIEVIQLPCVENQITLCKSSFFEDICNMSTFFINKQNLIDRLFEEQTDFNQLFQLYNQVLIAIMSVMEANDDKIFEDLETKLDAKFLIDFLKSNLDIINIHTSDDLQKYLQSQNELFSEDICNILNVIVIKIKITNRKTVNKKWVDNINQIIQSDRSLDSIIQILERRIRNIEIVYEGHTQIISFLSQPVFDFLSDQTKEKIMDRVNRETQREKIHGLINESKTIFNEIEYNFRLNQSKIPVTHRTISMTRNLASFISFLINILMVLFYTVEIKNKFIYLEAEIYQTVILTALSITQILISSASFIFYLISRAPLTLMEINLQQQVVHNNKKIQNKFRLFFSQIELRFWQLQYLSINEDDFIQNFVYFIISILGCFYKEYFFSLHLFDLFGRLQLLKNVLQAISYNAKQLVVVSMLGVLFVFVFSITGFDNYVNDIYQEDEPVNHCESLIRCMITLSTSGVVGNNMLDWDPVKFFLDTVYFVFFGLLFTNIVSGIMIDTFAELRDKRQKIEDDKKNYCYICGCDRQTTEKNGEKIQDHIKQKHELWNYIFYIYTLTKKDSTEYTGLEYWISAKLKIDDISWFPVIVNDNNLIIDHFNLLNQNLEEQINNSRVQLLNKIEQLENEIKQSKYQIEN